MTWPVSLADDELPGSRVVKTRARARADGRVPRLPPGRDRGRGAVPGARTRADCEYSHSGGRPLRMIRAPATRPTGVVAQYDAIFSVGDRRNEVAEIPLSAGPPWDDDILTADLGLGSWCARPPPRRRRRRSKGCPSSRRRAADGRRAQDGVRLATLPSSSGPRRVVAEMTSSSDPPKAA